MVTSKPPPRRPPFKGGSNARGYLNPVMAKNTKTNNSVSLMTMFLSKLFIKLIYMMLHRLELRFI